MTLRKLCQEYLLYVNMDAFKVGFVDYQLGNMRCPYSSDSVDAQAWDRGAECAMRWERLQREGR